MKVNLEIIEISKKVYYRRRILLISLLFYPVFGIIFQPTPGSLANNIMASVFLSVILINIYYRAKYKRYNEIGKLHLNKDLIILNGNEVKLSDIKSICIEYNGFKGEAYPFAPFGISLFGTKDGADNFFEILMNNKEATNLMILIKSEDQIIVLNALLEYYAKLQIESKWIKSKIHN